MAGVRGVERQESLLAVRAASVPQDVSDLVDLEIHRPRSIGDHVVLVRVVGHVDPVRALRKQIDRRRAEQRETRLVDDAFEAGLVAAEEQDELDLVHGPRAADGVRQADDIDEAKPLRKREVFLQKPISLEAAERHRQQRFTIGEAGGPDAAGRQERMTARRALRRQHECAQGLTHAQFVQLVGRVLRP